MIRVKIRIPGNVKVNGKQRAHLILAACRKESILGATVIRCDFGYGEHEYKHHIIRNLTDLPQLIEIVDEPEEIMRLLPVLKKIVQDNGLITIEEVMAV